MNMNRSRPGLGLGFALGVSINNQTGVGGGGLSFSTSFSDINTGLFGTDTSISGSSSGTEKTDVTQIEKLNIDEEGLLRLIDKSLEGIGGLASIFGGEAGAGLFGSSSAKLQTEDLLAKIAGELALITGEKVATNVGTKESTSTSSQSSESSGIIDSVGEMFGGLF